MVHRHNVDDSALRHQLTKAPDELSQRIVRHNLWSFARIFRADVIAKSSKLSQEDSPRLLMVLVEVPHQQTPPIPEAEAPLHQFSLPIDVARELAYRILELSS